MKNELLGNSYFLMFFVLMSCSSYSEFISNISNYVILYAKKDNHKIIHHYLEKYDNDVLLVAKKLSIGKSTIYRMLKEE